MRHGKATASTTRTTNAAAAPVPGAVSQCAVVTWMSLITMMTTAKMM
jgi:hypothetical protein